MRNVLLSGADRTGWLVVRLARNLAEIDITYRSGWSIDGSTAVERLAPKGDAALPGADPSFRLVVPSAHADDATAVAIGFPVSRRQR